MNSPPHQNKFRAYRARKRDAGLREVRMWVPDMRASGFWERSVKAAAILDSVPEEADTTAFFDALNEETPDDWD